MEAGEGATVKFSSWKLLIRRRFRPLVITICEYFSNPNLLPQHCLVVLKGIIRWEIKAWETQTWPHGNQQNPGFCFHRTAEATTSLKLVFGVTRLLPEAGKRVNSPHRTPKAAGSDMARHTSTTAGSPQGPDPNGTEQLGTAWSGREEPSVEKGSHSLTQRTGGREVSSINTAPWERTWKNRKLHSQQWLTHKTTQKKKLFSFSWEPSFQSPPLRQPKHNTQDHSFLFIHKSLGWGKGIWGKADLYFLLPFSRNEIQMSWEKRGGSREEKIFQIHMKSTPVAWTQWWK